MLGTKGHWFLKTQCKREYSIPYNGERSLTVYEKYSIIAGDKTQKPWRLCAFPYSWTIPAGICFWPGCPETWHPKTPAGHKHTHFIPVQVEVDGLYQTLTSWQSLPIFLHSSSSVFSAAAVLCWLCSLWCFTHPLGSLEAVKLPAFCHIKVFIRAATTSARGCYIFNEHI